MDISLVFVSIYQCLFVYFQLSVFNLETLANDISDYYGDKRGQPEVQQYAHVANHIATKHFHKFVSNLWKPACMLFPFYDKICRTNLDFLLKSYKLMLKKDNFVSFMFGSFETLVIKFLY